MKKKVLLLGSSFSAAPMLFELKNMGFCVEVCGDITSDPCHQYSDESIKIDYSKKRKLLNFLKEKKIDYVVPTCNDDS
jgi:formate-dependent phosphoribosylglycinamide formyltransferase (GAR transformylase)